MDNVTEKFNALMQAIDEYKAEQGASSKGARELSEKQPLIPILARLVVQFAIGGIRVGIEQIKDELARDFALFGLNNTAEIVELLTDDNKQNLAQIEEWMAANWHALAKEGGMLVLRVIGKYSPANSRWSEKLNALSVLLSDM